MRKLSHFFPIILDGSKIYTFDLPVRNVTGQHFKAGVVTCDGQNLVFVAADKGSRDALMVVNAKTGGASYKIPMRQAGVKVCEKRQQNYFISFQTFFSIF